MKGKFYNLNKKTKQNKRKNHLPTLYHKSVSHNICADELTLLKATIPQQTLERIQQIVKISTNFVIKHPLSYPYSITFSCESVL